mmetsp:Transcript_32251/g.94309  ORF Transcript_32251/g.94309 Transcript_32251/m.94309 type:complete len:247 (+) Transcript_32251:1049-1789(+)
MARLERLRHGAARRLGAARPLRRRSERLVQVLDLAPLEHHAVHTCLHGGVPMQHPGARLRCVRPLVRTLVAVVILVEHHRVCHTVAAVELEAQAANRRIAEVPPPTLHLPGPDNAHHVFRGLEARCASPRDSRLGCRTPELAHRAVAHGHVAGNLRAHAAQAPFLGKVQPDERSGLGTCVHQGGEPARALHRRCCVRARRSRRLHVLLAARAVGVPLAAARAVGRHGRARRGCRCALRHVGWRMVQ